MRFWDASAVVALCVDEAGSDVVVELLRADSHMAVWWATPVEGCSALARLRRMGSLTIEGEREARGRLAAYERSWTELAPTRTLRRRATRLLGLHELRAADALQLAAALSWAGAEPEDHAFVCLDQRLCEAARLEGFVVLPAAESDDTEAA